MILRVDGEQLEGVDAWNVGAITVPRPTFALPVLLTPSDVNGLITLDIYLPPSSTVVYTTTFAKTLQQDGATDAIHAALVDSRWAGLDAVGHNFVHKIRMADLTPAVLKGGRTYTMVYSIPTVQDGTVKAIFTWTVIPLH